MEWARSVGNLKLGNHRDRTENLFVLLEWVAEWLAQNRKLFEAAIDRLMAVASQILCFFLLTASIVIWADNLGALVTAICLNTFTLAEPVLEAVIKNFLIIPHAACVRSINPNNMTRLDADTNLITQSGTLKFMRVPRLRKRVWLTNAKVSAIDGDEASTFPVGSEVTIVPNNL